MPNSPPSGRSSTPPGGIPVALPFLAPVADRPTVVDLRLTGAGGALDLSDRLADGLEAAVVVARALTSGCRIATAGGDDTLIGSRFADWIEGCAGTDMLEGGRGADALIGGTGRDLLSGGLGRDTLAGGAGADVFVYAAVSDSTGGARDTILDLGAADRINLAAIDADRCKAGNQAFNSVGEFGRTMRIGTLYVEDGVLRVDIDGDKVADFEIAIDTGVALGADHFYL